MNSKMLAIGHLIFGASLLAAQTAPTGVPKTYGTGFQAVHVGAAAFRPRSNTDYYFSLTGDGYVYNGEGSVEVFQAPVTMQAGAEIYALCAYVFDDLSTDDVEIQLSAGRLIPGGTFPAAYGIGPRLTSYWDSGYGVTCTDFSLPYTYTEASPQDGVALHYFLSAIVPPWAGIGGVKIIWRQQVSPPPASATFNDVPTGHPFFQFVEALAASGITAGCGPGKFCPEAPLTRGQMAVFLSKALGLHWPN